MLFSGFFSCIFRTAVEKTYIICDNKNLASYISDNKANPDPKSNLFIILEYFLTQY